MFKFLKELIDSAKEGFEEAQIEVEAENKKNIEAANLQGQETTAQIETIPYNEKFGTALGAHFRVVIFGDWFSIFKNNQEDDDLYPIHLYSFGDYPQRDKYRGELQKGLKRDFLILDKTSSLAVLATYFDIAGISRSDTLLAGVEYEDYKKKISYRMWDASKQGAPALLTSVLSHMITATTDVGYIEKSDALLVLDKVIAYAKSNYGSWDSFNKDFFIGEAQVGLNNKAGKAILSKYATYLLEKKGSPWNNLTWQ